MPAEHVISTIPGPDARAEKGSTVIMQVSTGPKIAAVPDVANKPEAEAQLFGRMGARKSEPGLLAELAGGTLILQSTGDPQQVWAGLEQWARAPQAGLCGAGRWQRP